MTPERLEEIRRLVNKTGWGDSFVAELLAEVDRLRGIFAGQADALTKVYAAVASPPDEFEGETDASVLHDELVMRLRSFEQFLELLRSRYDDLHASAIERGESYGSMIHCANVTTVIAIQAQGRTLGLFPWRKK